MTATNLAKSDTVFERRNDTSVDLPAKAEANFRQVALVDGDNEFREAACMALSDHGFAVEGFSTEQALLAHFEHGGVADAIVLDWVLPDGTGLQLLETLRRRGIDVPVVFLTDLPAAAYENLALSRGAADFVDKARGVEIFAKRLHLIMEWTSPGHAPPTAFRHGFLTLRADTKRAYWKGVDVELTLTEFNIVERLISDLGDYVSYRQIYDCVHHAGFVAGSGEDGFRTNVRTSVKRIRNKFRELDATFGEIQNYAAFGYRWGVPVSVQPKPNQAA